MASEKKKRELSTSYWLVIVIAASLFTMFISRSYLSYEEINRIDNRSDQNRSRIIALEKTSVLANAERANNSQRITDFVRELESVNLLLKDINKYHSEMTFEQRIAALEQTIAVYRPIFDILTSNDIKVLEKMQEELGGGKPESSLPLRTAFSLLVASKLYDLDVNLLAAVAHVESRFNPEAESSANAKGLMQLSNLMWKNYRGLFPWDIEVDVHDELLNTLVAARFLHDLHVKYGGNVAMVLQHYNGGPKAISEGRSRNYAKSVIGQSEEFATLLN